MASLCTLASILLFMLWYHYACGQPQTTPPTPKIPETVQVYKYRRIYEPLILVYSSSCRQWYSWLDSRNQLRLVCFCFIDYCNHTRVPLSWPHIYTVVVYPNFEAGKQLVISTINGNDTLGWTDLLTRVDLRRKFQYFLYCERLTGTYIHIHTCCGFYFPFVSIDLVITAYKPVEVVWLLTRFGIGLWILHNIKNSEYLADNLLMSGLMRLVK